MIFPELIFHVSSDSRAEEQRGVEGSGAAGHLGETEQLGSETDREQFREICTKVAQSATALVTGKELARYE